MARALLAGAVALLATAASASAIVGGRPATEAYPFMASLQVDGDHICGASLLAPDRVLTAAHCVQGERVGALRVVLGRRHLSSSAGRVHRVADATIHPRYEPSRSDAYDVAVLRLSEPSDLSAVRLASPSETHLWAPGATARVLGWGDSVFVAGLAPEELHEVDLSIVDDSDCRRLNRRFFDPETMVCAGEDEGLRDSCQGDSGGPLLVRGAREWLQVGTVSLGTGCGLPLVYGIYARVAADPLRSWIIEQAGLGAVPPAAPPAPISPTDPGTDPGTEPTRPRVRVRRDLGSARAARRRGALRLRLRTSAPLRTVRVKLHRRGRVVARGRRAEVIERATIRLRVRRARPGRMRVVVRAVDAGGRPVRAAFRVRLRR